jgi:serine/threonine-protein kinase|tara:strand:- start:146 stop:1744 length:1599 start_codon:yes stop_codon:yes gene_type:complete
MKKYLLHVLIISFVFLSTTVIHSAEEEKDRLLVIPLKSQIGLKKEEAIILSDVLSTELHKSGKFTILSRGDMKAILDEKEFELAMSCDDNNCLIENVEKLAVSKIITGNIGKLGTKFVVTVRMINKDGENEVMEKDICDCPLEGLVKSMERVSYKFLSYLKGEEVPASESLSSREEPSYGTVSRTSLQSPYRDLPVSKVQSMPNVSIRKKDSWGFYGHSTINNSYEKKSINEDTVVIDNATGLVWYQSSSKNYLTYKEAEEWLENLNKKGYAGYHDWRLPTLEEAVSILEPSKSNDLYIDPIFDNKEWYIWTGDKLGSGAAWRVHLNAGAVDWDEFSSMFGVLPVRSFNRELKPAIRLRSSYKVLSVSQAQSMPNVSIRKMENLGFCGHSTINHYYEKKSINEDTVVIDYTTGLMWRQNGSDAYKWKKAEEWLKNLNSSGYAGFGDWRLPTLEEAVSLLEPSNRYDRDDIIVHHYINPIFSYEQSCIWTGDKNDKHHEDFWSAKWTVNFLRGDVFLALPDHHYHVRPVRSMK